MNSQDKQRSKTDEAATQNHHHHHYYAEQPPGYQFTYRLRISTGGLLLLVGISIAGLLIMFTLNRIEDSQRSPTNNINTTITVRPAVAPTPDLIKQTPAPAQPTPRHFKLRRMPADTQIN